MTHKPLQLRPLSVGDLLDTVFRLYRQHFWLFVGLVAVVQVPFTLLTVIYDTVLGPTRRVQAVVNDPDSFWWLYPSTREYEADMVQLVLVQLLTFLLTLFVIYGLTNGAMARVVHKRYLGHSLSLVDAYKALGERGRWLRLLGAFVVLGILDVVILLLFLIPCLGWVVGFILLIYFNVPVLSFLAPVVVVEDQKASAALGRAFKLGQRKFWRVLGINVLLGLLTGIISAGLPFLAGVAFAFWEPSFLVTTLITALLGLVMALLVRPIWACGLALLYFDLRVRLEGFDLEVMAERMDVGASSPAA